MRRRAVAGSRSPITSSVPSTPRRSWCCCPPAAAMLACRRQTAAVPCPAPEEQSSAGRYTRPANCRTSARHLPILLRRACAMEQRNQAGRGPAGQLRVPGSYGGRGLRSALTADRIETNQSWEDVSALPIPALTAQKGATILADVLDRKVDPPPIAGVP